MSRDLAGFLMYAVHGLRLDRRRRRRRRARRGPARSWKYRRWIRAQSSAVSGKQDWIRGRLCCEAAHTGDDGGMRQKPSDYTCIPLTSAEHAEYHSLGRSDFERRHGVSCRELVSRLNHAWFAHAAEVK